MDDFPFSWHALLTGKVEDEGLGMTIYMTMGGTIDSPTFSMDSDERKNDGDTILKL